MARVKRGVTQRARHKKVLELAKGFHSGRSRLHKTANEAVLHSLAYQYRDRRQKKRDFRRLWITRINAATRELGLPYSVVMSGLKRAGIGLNRKMLAEIAVTDPGLFATIVDQARHAEFEAAAGPPQLVGDPEGVRLEVGDRVRIDGPVPVMTLPSHMGTVAEIERWPMIGYALIDLDQAATYRDEEDNEQSLKQVRIAIDRLRRSSRA